ncbi:hypothetical protein AB0305_03995 [Arthrobacter sp. NPDC080086]|uniref:hypothetical protein n=1 Tax=Arthrobacter sp. NPDC080086 TaxID=3155917 RepID=UPI003450B395
MSKPQVEALLARHAAAPQVSTREYVETLVAELGASIAGRHKLYLDTRYWIHLRDAAMGRSVHPAHSEILDLIRSLVSTGVAICPVSDVAWMELSKQRDPETRLATADVLDELSLGVAIKSEQERVVAELEQVIMRPDLAATPPNQGNRVWVKACYVLGITVPMVKNWSDEQNLLFQKASVDLIWQLTHREMAETEGSFQQEADRLEQAAKSITDAMRRYSHEIRSIQQAFAAESAGALRAFKNAIQALIVRAFMSTASDTGSVTKEQVDVATEQMLSGLANAFRLRPKVMAQRVPSLYAYAMCHAAVRMDRSRKLNAHDLLDIHHASSGIPYHDAVFTENPLRVLVTAGNIALDKTFQCAVLSKESEILDYLRRFPNAQPG